MLQSWSRHLDSTDYENFLLAKNTLAYPAKHEGRKKVLFSLPKNGKEESVEDWGERREVSSFQKNAKKKSFETVALKMKQRDLGPAL